ncbi:MAG TPA: tail fiber domain-containing protein [Longimicrobium sp.]|nr:tail fiber domain-containing protein [Longimicrobium sp.]
MNRLLRFPIAAAAVLLAAAPAAAQTPDSAFAVSAGGMGLFRVNVDGGALWGGVYDGDGSGTGIPAEGAGTRMMWYPRKGAFRAGGINGTQWDAANIGDYSVAIGQDVRASASNAVAFGLRSTAAQQSSFAVGEDNTASGAASVAMGYHAHTNARQGSFVFSDRSSVDTLRAGVNHSANWRVSGGFRIFTSSNLSTGVTIQSGSSVSNWGQSDAVISTSTGAYLSGGGVWTNNSDVNRKHAFAHIDGEDILARLRNVPMMTWSYNDERGSVRHLGPTAQAFYGAFRLGPSATSIPTVDADGVALAGVQALDTRTLAQAARIDALERENAALRARLERIEAALAAQAVAKP